MQKHRRSNGPGTGALFAGLTIAAVVASAACGTLEVRDLKDTFGNKRKGTNSSDQDWANVRVGVTPSQLLVTRLTDDGFTPENFSLFAFDLVNSTSFKFKVTGCASGFSVAPTTIQNAYQTEMKLYKTDKNCEVGLVEFNYDSKIYSVQTGAELKGVAGTSAIFSAGSGDDLKVKVYKQLLAGGIVNGQEAAFTFLKSTKGTDANVVDYTSGSPLAVNGIEAPAFSILSPNGVELTDIASSDGKATYKFTLQCAQNLVTSGGSDHACPRMNGETDPQLINRMAVKLIHDVADKSTYTYDEIETIMASGTTPVTNSMKVGASTTNIQVPNMVGPGKLVDYKQMVLIISYSDPSTPTRGTSYKYFNVDIGAPVP